MDYNKVRYDLALQAATARLIKYGYDSHSITDSEALLGFLAVCYDDARKISDQDIRDIFKNP